MIDLLIRAARVVDGTGADAFTADVGIDAGRIVEIGRIGGAAHRTIDADGALLTPGFVDIHTHYDGQASWDETFSPSVDHGVTTVVMGNCGVGFAPVRPGEQERLLQLMEGVEEIPGAALAEGIRWGWQGFAEYAARLDAMPHSIDFMTLVPHDCLRLYVMGDRAARGAPATADDRAQMASLLREALAAGAAGFSTGRTDNHRTTLGEPTPAHEADREELLALARAFHGLPHRVMHAVSDFDCMRGAPEEQKARFDVEYTLLEDVARELQGDGGVVRPLALTWLQRLNAPMQGAWLGEAAARSRAQGLDIRLQTACRAIGVINGLDTTFNALMAFPSYQAIADLPLPERAARLRDPALKARLLAETPVKMARDGSAIPPIVDQLLANFEQTAKLLFPFGSTGGTPDYEPDPRSCFWAQAQARGVSSLEAVYDWLAAGDGGNLVYFPIFNYLGGSLDHVGTMLRHPQALLALSDAGAHVGTVCDASLPTTLLATWARDRNRGPLLPLEQAVAMLSGRNAAHMGLADRGTVRVGQRADLNLIDHARLRVRMPELVRDLPAGGRRFVQRADGYLATLVAGQVVCEAGRVTPARPGRWVRSTP